MFKLEKIKVNNFKNIVNTEIDLNNFNVVVGPNNSGKSNLLQVIPFLRKVIKGAEEYEYIMYSTFPTQLSDKTSVRLSVEIEFLKVESNFRYRYSANFHRKMEPYEDSVRVVRWIIQNERFDFKQGNTTGRSARIFERDENDVTWGDAFKSKFAEIADRSSVFALIDLMPQNNIPEIYRDAILGFKNILNSEIFYFSSFELLKPRSSRPQEYLGERKVYANLGREIEMILNEQKKSELFYKLLLDVLQISAIESTPLSVQETSTGTEEWMVSVIQLGQEKYLEDLSDGTILLIALITEILSAENDIIFIEEPENSIHPKALQELISFMKSYADEKQFVITTHSGFLLNMIDPSNVIVAHLNEKGLSTFEKVKNIKEIKRKLNKGFVSFGDLLVQNIDEEKEGETVTY